MERVKEENPKILEQVEVIGEYRSKYTPILGRTKYGLVNINPRIFHKINHMTIRCALDKTDYYINKAKEKHKERFNYSLLKYIDQKTEIKILCREHGLFAVLPEEHFSASGGCLSCAQKYEHVYKRRLTHAEYINRLDKDYVEIQLAEVNIINFYRGMDYRLYAIDKYGLLDINPHTLCNNYELNYTHAFNLQFYLKSLLKDVYKNRYNYDLACFSDMNTDVQIVCPLHGIFLKTPIKHLNGEGCPDCSLYERGIKLRLTHVEFLKKLEHKNPTAYHELLFKEGYKRHNFRLRADSPHGEVLVEPGALLQGRYYLEDNRGWSKGDYVKRCGTRSSNCYIVSMHSDTETFYKIGISMDVKKRLSNSSIPYEYRTIKIIPGDPGFVWDLEKILHKKHKFSQYIPLRYFRGRLECFSALLPEEEINKIVQKTIIEYKE